MERQEFINGLKAALSGRLPAAEVEEHIDYYQDYINREIRSGRSGEEVLGELGDPRLIARTILQTSGQPARPDGMDADRRDETNASSVSGFSARIPAWLIALVCVVVVLVILGAVFSVLSAFLPLIIVMAVVLLLIKVFRDWM